MLMEYSNDDIGNRTRDFLACSAMPQWTAPTLTSVVQYFIKIWIKLYVKGNI